MQGARNAVILSKLRQRSSNADVEEKVDTPDQSFKETYDKALSEKNKFQSFWSGIKKGVEANEYILSRRNHEIWTKQKNTRKGWVFNPDNSYKIVWDLFLIGLVLYSIVIIPYRIGFDVSPTKSESDFELFITIIFGFDILLSFNTAYLHPIKEKLIFNRKQIAINYFKFWFWIDLFATLPFDTIIGAFYPSSKFGAIRVIRILRMVRLFKLYRILNRSSDNKQAYINPGIMNLVTLMLQIFFIAHIFACFWHYITLEQSAGSFPETWVTKFGYEHSGKGTLYVASLYYIIVTMLTVGYGDIYATNQLERFYAILTMLCGAIIFGALVGKVTSLIEKRNPQAKAFSEKMDEFKEFAADINIPMALRNKAKEAYEYYLTKKSTLVDSGLFSGLPDVILIELVRELYKEDIKRVKFFEICEPMFVVNIVQQLKPFQASPLEIIYDEGDILNSIVIVKSGCIKISIISGREEIKVGYINQHDFFGDAEFYKNTTSLARYSSIGYSHLFNLSHNALASGLSASFNSSENFNKLIAKRYEAFFTILTTCNRKEHDHLTIEMDDKTKQLYLSKHRDSIGSSNIYVDGEIKNFEHEKNQLLHLNLLMIATYEKGQLVSVEEYPYEILFENKLFDPNGFLKVNWDFFVGVLIIYSILVVPIEIGFNGIAYEASPIVDMIINGFFFVDILFSFRTAIYNEQINALVISPSYIAFQYLKNWFVIDIVSTVPFDTIVNAAMSGNSANLAFTKLVKIIRLLRLLKMARILKLGKYVEIIELYLGVSPALFRLLSLIIQVYFIAHWVCCLWWGLTASISSYPWYDVTGPDGFVWGKLVGESIAARYLVTIYYIFTTMTTVGYGDIHPINSAERILCIFLILTGASIFGYMIANVSSALNSINSGDSSGKEKLIEINEFLSEKNCPPNLISKVSNHFQRQFKETTSYDIDSIIARLPPMISNEILLVVHESKMNKIKIFKYICNKSVAVYIFTYMKPVYYEALAYMMKEGEVSEGISFLISGEARAFKKLDSSKNKESNKANKSKIKLKNVAKRFLSINNIFGLKKEKEETNEMKSNPNSPKMKKSVLSSQSSDKIRLKTSQIQLMELNKQSQDNPKASKLSSYIRVNFQDPIEDHNDLSFISDSNPSNYDRGMSLHEIYSDSEYDIPELIETNKPDSQTPEKSPKKILSGIPDFSKLSSYIPSSKVISGLNQSGQILSSIGKTIDSTLELSDVKKLFSPTSYSQLFASAEIDVDALDSLETSFGKLTRDQYLSLGYHFISQIHPGDIFGHHVFLNELDNNDSSVRTVIPSTIYTLSKADMAKIIRVEPTVGIQLQKALLHAIKHQFDTRSGEILFNDNKNFKDYLTKSFTEKVVQGIVNPAKDPKIIQTEPLFSLNRDNTETSTKSAIEIYNDDKIPRIKPSRRASTTTALLTSPAKATKVNKVNDLLNNHRPSNITTRRRSTLKAVSGLLQSKPNKPFPNRGLLRFSSQKFLSLAGMRSKDLFKELKSQPTKKRSYSLSEIQGKVNSALVIDPLFEKNTFFPANITLDEIKSKSFMLDSSPEVPIYVPKIDRESLEADNIINNNHVYFKRRQSFPSLDNINWKRHILKDGLF